MAAALIIGMWRWSGVVGCNLGRELDRTYGDHMAAHCTNALSTQMSPQSLSCCHLLPIDETSNGLWLIGQHRHIDVQTPRRPDNFESCCHIDRMMCTLPKQDKNKQYFFSKPTVFCSFNVSCTLETSLFGYRHIYCGSREQSRKAKQAASLDVTILLVGSLKA